MRKLIFCYFSAMFLIGCNATQSYDRMPLEVPDAPELKMRPVNWEIQDSKICLSPEMYSNLSLNTDDIKGYIQYQNNVIKIYKDYYKTESRSRENSTEKQ